MEQRVARLETLFEDVLKERINHIATRLDQLYEKTEGDKTELLEKMLILQAKTDSDKRELILWMIGLLLGFSTLIITSMWAILSFALKH